MTGKEKKPAVKTQNGVQKKISARSSGKKPGKTKKRYRHTVFEDWCKNCGICRSFCPKNVIGRDEHGRPVFERPEDCIGCRFCELHCPDFAITVQELDQDTGGDP